MSYFRRGLTERTFFLYNPLPSGITEAELLKRAALPDIVPSERPPFAFVWRYSASNERETLVLDAGSTFPLREREARDWLREFKEQGGMLLEDPKNDAALRAAQIDGLRQAVRFFRARGKVRVQEFRKGKGLTPEELEDRRHELYAYHLNEAKAEVVKEHLDRLLA